MAADNETFITRFAWTIKNFHMCPQRTGERIYSPEFCVAAYKFSFFICPRGFLDPAYISVYLERMNDSGEKEILVKRKMYVVDEDAGASPDYYSRSERVYGKFYAYGIDEFMVRKKLLTTERSTLLPNNNLTIQCDIISLSVVETNENDSKLNDKQDVDGLSRDFGKILNTGLYSDMVIIVEEHKFNVHKVILECRCQKLISLIEETDVANVYRLNNIDVSSFRLLLQYLYTGTLSIIGSNMYEKILNAADNFKDFQLSLFIPCYKSINAATEIVISSKQSFNWLIPDFSKLQLEQEQVYPVPCYTSEEWSQMNIILTVMKTENGSDGIQLRFRKLSNSDVDFIHCKIVIDVPRDSISNDNIFQIFEYEYTFISDEDWVIPLGSQIELGQILFNDALKMGFEICMSKKETNSNIVTSLVKDKTEIADCELSLNQFQKDLRNLINNANNSKSADISLSIGDDILLVHKVILCGRSPVFAMMFEHDTLEKEEGIITVEDMEPETMSSILLYVYCGRIDKMNFSEGINLYEAADKYQLLSLRDKCSTFLKTSMNLNYVDVMLQLAEAHNDESLKSYVYDYLISNSCVNLTLISLK